MIENMYDDRWRTIDTHPNYRVSDDGEIVQNIKTGRILKQCDNNKGYRTINLYNNRVQTTVGVHRLVADQYVAGGNPNLTVNHKDGNKHNNRLDNLEWVTYGENELHSHRIGLKHGPNRKPVRVVESGEIFPSIKACARAIGGNDTNIRRCLKGQYNSHHGLTFEYIDVNPDEIESNDGVASRICGSKEPYRKPVRIVETGVEYPSVRACAKAIGGDQPTITGCLKGRHKSHKGYHYEWVQD